ncbi:MAG: DUF547 domain-containing protein [Sandaracinaceae bacterium]|nr:DUF547 domain-containing protein [Sandaracinaceae bacterium]
MPIFDALRDAWDIARRARGVGEIAKAVVPGLGPPIVLNEGDPPDLAPAELIRALRNARNELKAHVSSGRVDYRALRDVDALAEIERLAPGLRRVTPADLAGDAERTAFFINLYNVLSIHGVIALGIESSVMEVPSFFGRVSYVVGEARLSLDAMENGVLRCNAGHPATGRPVLRAGSPGLAYAPSVVDPRIHAALVCASTSCPPVGFYDAERLDAQLDLASGAWVNAAVRVDDEGVRAPITLRYYAADWGGRAGIEAFLLAHADAPLRASLEAAFGRGAPLLYDRYDWSLNFV